MGKSEKVIGNFIWRLLERFGAQGVTLIISVVLARLLDPEVYGTIALVTVFTSLLHVLSTLDSGLRLFRKKMRMILIFHRYSISIWRCVLYCTWGYFLRRRT